MSRCLFFCHCFFSFTFLSPFSVASSDNRFPETFSRIIPFYLFSLGFYISSWTSIYTSSLRKSFFVVPLLYKVLVLPTVFIFVIFLQTGLLDSLISNVQTLGEKEKKGPWRFYNPMVEKTNYHTFLLMGKRKKGATSTQQKLCLPTSWHWRWAWKEMTIAFCLCTLYGFLVNTAITSKQLLHGKILSNTQESF